MRVAKKAWDVRKWRQIQVFWDLRLRHLGGPFLEKEYKIIL